jgi:replicative DNA helicase
MGKTSFALSIVRNVTIGHKIPTLYFSLEMNSASVVNRIIANICSIPAHKIQNGKLLKEEWESLDNNIPSIAKAPLYLDDTARLSINDLSNTARNCVIDHGVKLIVIDYFQLIQTRDRSNRSRHDELAELMHELKILARELNVPIVLLSQLNRALEDREGFEGKRPKLSDLRECGAIEDDSDVVMFVHRPECYHIYQDEMGRDLRGMAQIIIAKHRMGHTGDVLLTFNGKYTRFENLQSIQTPPLEVSDELF